MLCVASICFNAYVLHKAHTKFKQNWQTAKFVAQQNETKSTTTTTATHTKKKLTYFIISSFSIRYPYRFCCFLFQFCVQFVVAIFLAHVKFTVRSGFGSFFSSLHHYCFKTRYFVVCLFVCVFFSPIF